MTIDEAIKHCLEVAEENDLAAGTYEILAKNNHNAYERLTAETNSSRCAECAADHRQLAEWLTELKSLREENKVLMQECDRLIKEKGELLKQYEQTAEYKRLLKAAVEDMRWVNENTQDTDGTCVMRKGEGCGDCPLDINGDLWCKWKHEAEALALIGEDGDY